MIRKVNAVPFQEMEAVDQYILRRTWALSADVIRYYKQFDFHKIYQSVNAFVISELSAFYLDVVKDRLYTYAPKSRGTPLSPDCFWRIGEAHGAAAGADHELHLRRGLAVFAEDGWSSRERAPGEVSGSERRSG